MMKILLIRFSALGDVAMTLPVVWSLARQYPDLEITILSRKSFGALFEQLPANVRFIGVDFKAEHRGVIGLHRLFYEVLNPLKFDYIADLHWVLRSMILDLRFRFAGASVAHIDKGRVQKGKLTRQKEKVFVPLRTSFERYADVFRKLGFPIKLDFTSIFEGKGDFSLIADFTGSKGADRWVGIAPFAKHQGKIFPLEKMEKIVAYFEGQPQLKLFLFGAGKEEREVLSKWKAKYPSVLVTEGNLRMNTELILMSHLDVMISMDSANMHLASLVGTPVVSIWGATHPFCGFLGWKQSESNCVQVDLDCRPCSVFGNKPCFRGDYACMNSIDTQVIIDRVEKICATPNCN
ncbi:MAG: glycosyltransferase family 9 protein [Bacteroidaceae bacterium]|nr:glycosyltransferase family 9 protein [Bacteroidaceae bacterium]